MKFPPPVSIDPPPSIASGIAVSGAEPVVGEVVSAGVISRVSRFVGSRTIPIETALCGRALAKAWRVVDAAALSPTLTCAPAGFIDVKPTNGSEVNGLLGPCAHVEVTELATLMDEVIAAAISK